MFSFVRNKTRVVQVVMFVLLALIAVSFVLGGLEGFLQFRSKDKGLAHVAGQPITQSEFDNAVRQQADVVRQQMPGIGAGFFDTPAFKQRVLDDLVRQRVLLHAAQDLRLVTPDARLARLIVSDPQVAPYIKPDGKWNTELLAAQGRDPLTIEALLRQQYSLRQVLAGIADTGLVPQAASRVALDAVFQRREVQIARIDAQPFAAQVQPTDAQLRAYYDAPAHAAQFQAPEQARVEYLVLDQASLKSGIKLAAEDVKAYYEQNAARFASPEERRASHILVKVDSSATPQQRQAARAKAESLLEQARKAPASFAELARKNSDDVGSAPNGGDLDWFGREAMTKRFEEAAFALKPGQISDVVETEFGYHIIQLTGVRGGERQPFEAVQAQIEDELRTQQAQRRYAEAAERFSNLVYEQADSLKPAADELKLSVRTADNVSRTPAPGMPPELNNAKLLEQLFASDALQNKRNTEAVETAPNQLVAARVVEYRPARKLAFDAVKAQVRQQVVASQAAQLAKQEAERRLAAWKAAPAQAQMDAPVLLSHGLPSDLPRPIVQAALRTPADKLPAWAAVDLGNNQGWAIVRINKLLPGDVSDDNAREAGRQFAQLWATAESQAYLKALKTRYKAKTDEATAAALAASAPAASAP
ncbi:MAG: peptidylprolyl isomerase [Burkholderiales bacterium]|nr:peptidylprolyl isomerase [Burkholderiales bacterium]